MVSVLCTEILHERILSLILLLLLILIFPSQLVRLTQRWCSSLISLRIYHIRFIASWFFFFNQLVEIPNYLSLLILIERPTRILRLYQTHTVKSNENIYDLIFCITTIKVWLKQQEETNKTYETPRSLGWMTSWKYLIENIHLNISDTTTSNKITLNLDWNV